MFGKQVMSDFASNSFLDDMLKLAKGDWKVNTEVIAGLNKGIAKKYATGARLKAVEQLLTDCIAILREQSAGEPRLAYIVDSEDNVVSFCCVELHAGIYKDVGADYYLSDNLMNKIKILVNLKLLPEHFLSIDAKYV